MTDLEALRSAVHLVSIEANKGIFNNLENVLLRLVDAIEAVSMRPLVLNSSGRWELRTGVSGQGENVTLRTTDGITPFYCALCGTIRSWCEHRPLRAEVSTERKGERRDG